ncbi:PTS sugar transporter subunit IIA [Parvularcula sp. LCG005]|uniref:PTS sugar transporter subunit IIA n=1 Tax=Parvularcula sp. LCG005 TaxID=3078805 RepID=UPI002943D5D3|nr:PTS sugar transporter subunit IIA [Parvularcula sp. LCG005]WOI52895.1 PTS sugar transporter subunit IIA [Parvularcula sp. LCG005]
MSSEIRSFLSSENVIVSMEASCKRSVLKQLAAHAQKTMGLDETSLLDSLLEREQLGSTGIGRGVAVPHARAEISQMRGIFARLAQPVDFDSIDDRPVDLVFLLLAPERADADHLKALSRVARLLRSDEVQDAMRGAADAEALYAIAVGDADAQAA